MKKFGLLGEGIGYSLSPKLHGTLFDIIGWDATYDLVDLPQGAFNFETVRKLFEGYSGFNVTIPYKEKIMDLLDYVEDSALRIGAVNTVKIANGIWTGYNTDYDGFDYTLKAMKLPLLSTAYVLGSGGASKVVQRVLKDRGFRTVCVVSRKDDGDMNYLDFEMLTKDERSKSLLVNCTPVGSKKAENQCPISETAIASQCAVIDLIYTPSETLLLKWASEQNIAYKNGLDMLIVQALRAEEIWWDALLDFETLLLKLKKVL